MRNRRRSGGWPRGRTGCPGSPTPSRPSSASGSARLSCAAPARIALVGGSGKDLIGPALAAGADTLVTGEVGYNAALDAAEAGLMILEAGHYFTEAPVLETLAEVCRGTADAACVFYDSNLSAVL